MKDRILINMVQLRGLSQWHHLQSWSTIQTHIFRNIDFYLLKPLTIKLLSLFYPQFPKWMRFVCNTSNGVVMPTRWLGSCSNNYEVHLHQHQVLLNQYDIIFHEFQISHMVQHGYPKGLCKESVKPLGFTFNALTTTFVVLNPH